MALPANKTAGNHTQGCGLFALNAGHRCCLASRMATPYLLRVLRSVCYCWQGPHIDCLPPLCTSCSCYKEISLSRRLKAQDRCWEMIWTSAPCWPTATSAGCCLSSSTPGREEAMQNASQTPEFADNIQGKWKRLFVFNKEAILTFFWHLMFLVFLGFMLFQMYICSTISLFLSISNLFQILSYFWKSNHKNVWSPDILFYKYFSKLQDLFWTSCTSIIIYSHKCCILFSLSICHAFFQHTQTLYSFISPIMESYGTASQCTVTWLLSMSDTLRFRGATTGPGKGDSFALKSEHCTV